MVEREKIGRFFDGCRLVKIKTRHAFTCKHTQLQHIRTFSLIDNHAYLYSFMSISPLSDMMLTHSKNENINL